MTDNNLKILFAAMVLILLASFGGDSKPEKSEVGAKNDSSANTNLPAGRAGLSKKLSLANPFGFLNSAPAYEFPVQKDWTLLAPDLKVKSAVAKDLDSDIEMLRFNTGEHWALASLTKLMSAVVVLEELGLNSS